MSSIDNLPANNLTGHQLKEKALACDRILTKNLYELLLVLSEIYNYKLYLYLDTPYKSFEEYCSQRWNYARSTALLYLEVANKFLPYYRDDLVQHVGLFSLGVAKMDILGNLDDGIIKKLSETGELSLDGETYTIPDLKKMDRETLKELVNKEKGLTEKPAENTNTEIPFGVVYTKVEKWFTNVLNTVYKCPEIDEPDQAELQILIYKASLIFDRYKKDIDALKKIK